MAKSPLGIDDFFIDGFGSFGGDFFNLHPTGLGGHEDQLAGGTVKDDAEIKFAIDGRGFFNREGVRLLALRAGLVGDECHAEDGLDVLVRIFTSAGDFDAATFAATAGCICALTTTPEAPSANSLRATAEASSGVLATSPLGTATPYFARISFA